MRSRNEEVAALSRLADEERELGTFSVERGKIREFAAAIGEGQSAYSDPEAARAVGYPDVIAPLTFGTAIELWSGLDFPRICRAMGMDPARVVHGTQEYEYEALILPGDAITATIRIGKVVQKEGRRGPLTIGTYETTFRNRHGGVVLIARCGLIQQG